MKRKLLAILAAGLMGGSMAAHAVPVDYNVAFDATTGPSGVGSLSWDADLGAILDFSWNFGGSYVGGVGNQFGSQARLGGTMGQLVFEMLSQTDVHPGVNCIGGCGVATMISTGKGPLGAAAISMSGNIGSSASYSFNSLNGTSLATGRLSLAQVVTEPGTLALLAAGVVGIGVLRRRRRAH